MKLPLLSDLFVRPDFDNSRITVSFTRPKDCCEFEYQILDGDEIKSSGTVHSIQSIETVVFDANMDDFKPWSVSSPFLYQLKLAIPGRNALVTQKFGMTKIIIEDRKIYFNNKPLYIRGFIRGRKGHDHGNLIGCTTTEFYEKNIRMAKAYGFNFVRFHTVLPPDEFFDAADRLGILCHIEIRKNWGRDEKERESTDFNDDPTLVDQHDWKTMLLKLRNHPCVLVYCLGNEIEQPGNNEQVKSIRKLTKKLDPTRLFLDTCSRGEYDRDTVDLDVQHMSYFAPFRRNHDMFNDSIHLSIYGSVTGKSMSVQDDEDGPAYVMQRDVPLRYPLLAHETCHYIALRDPYKLDRKFRDSGCEKPWWIDELIKMIQAKGHQNQYQKMLDASARFQFIWLKQNFESVRKSPLLEGFHFLQLADCDDYENANGLLDCFDDPKRISPDEVVPFNGSTVLIADLPKRALFAGAELSVPIFVSHYPEGDFESGTLSWQLSSRTGEGISISASMDDFDLSKSGNRKLCRIKIHLPSVDQPQELILRCELTSENGKHKARNHWNLWLFPDRPDRIADLSATICLKNVNLNKRYTQITSKGGLDDTEPLLICDHFNEGVINHLEQGKDALILYRIDENRDKEAPREEYYLPSTWDRFKPTIWDRGLNCGGFLREHPVSAEFPHDGLLDWQFFYMIDDCDKIDLDGFPVPVEPIIEGVDKAVRDRFDVGRFDLSEFQYAYTLRKFAYLFELKVGRGRLVIAGLNFKSIETAEPATCWMFESIVNYMQSEQFDPKTDISAEEFSKYLLDKGQSKRIKERMMTQYWQLDDAPLESSRYWKESEEWLRRDD